MNNINAEAVAQLRKIAELVESVGAALHVRVTVNPRDEYGPDEAERVALVDVLAARLGLTAATSNRYGTWQHIADRYGQEASVHLRTRVADPADRCACGAVCEHTAADLGRTP